MKKWPAPGRGPTRSRAGRSKNGQKQPENCPFVNCDQGISKWNNYIWQLSSFHILNYLSSFEWEILTDNSARQCLTRLREGGPGRSKFPKHQYLILWERWEQIVSVPKICLAFDQKWTIWKKRTRFSKFCKEGGIFYQTYKETSSYKIIVTVAYRWPTRSILVQILKS